MIVTDRLSAFDVVLPKGIPYKGQILNQIDNLSSTNYTINSARNNINGVSKLLIGNNDNQKCDITVYAKSLSSIDDPEQTFFKKVKDSLVVEPKTKVQLYDGEKNYKNGPNNFPIGKNIHENHILKHTYNPISLSEDQTKKLINYSEKIITELNHIGVLAVEFFITKDQILVNEIAPRVHNSGHLTINAFNISQFENHVRAVCDLGPEKVEKISNAEMFNVLGKDIETYRSKTFNKDEFFYDSGKKSIKIKRKMGHFTVLKK